MHFEIPFLTLHNKIQNIFQVFAVRETGLGLNFSMRLDGRRVMQSLCPWSLLHSEIKAHVLDKEHKINI